MGHQIASFLANFKFVSYFLEIPKKSIKRRILEDLNELHASNQWENLRRIQLESGTATTAPTRVDLTPADVAQGGNSVADIVSTAH